MYNLLDRLAFGASLTRKTAALLTVVAAVGCAEAGDSGNVEDASGFFATTPDATLTSPVFPTSPTNTQIPELSNNLDASVTPADATVMSTYPDAAPRPDATVDGSNPFDFGSLFPTGTPDSSVPPEAGPGGWKLKPDSAKECPAEPPPLPIIGGLCTGIYFFCGWTNDKGQQYTCTCDWIHWLCI